MIEYTRYAVYYAPPQGSGLARFGASWLGWDNLAGTCVARPDLPDAPCIDLEKITENPQKYGFHGTLKPPFRLAPNAKPGALATEIEALAARCAPFTAPALTLKPVGRFLALVPSGPCQALVDLAGACVLDPDRFRAEPTEAEIAKRRKGGLTPQQDAMLLRWGYPYVFEEFRFHLTLTGPLDAATQEDAFKILDPMVAAFCQDPMPVKDIVLFGEVNGGQFHQIARYALTG